MPDSLLIFDIETVIDDEACRSLFNSPSLTRFECGIALHEYHNKATGNPFPKQLFHQVVAIGCLICNIETHPIHGELFYLKKIGCMHPTNERGMLEEFFGLINKKRPRLVSFNGRGFDIPVLKYRAMKHGLCCGALEHKDYCYRYSLDWHCDLLEALCDFGASSRNVKLTEVCALIGAPGKIGIDGSSVAEMYEKGEIESIRDYCETDVISTYLVYLRYALRSGIISTESHRSAVDELILYLGSSSKQRWGEFLSVWGK